MRKLTIAVLAIGSIAAAGLIAWAAAGATIRIVDEDVVLLVTFKDRSTIKVTSKPRKINPGEYEVKKYSFFKQDDKKDTWELRCNGGGLGTMKMLMVAPGQDKIIDPGPPLRLRLYVRQGKGENSDTVGITLTFTGKYSEVYDPWAYKVGDRKRKPKPPVVIIKDPAGEVLKKVVMTVTGKQCRYDWEFGDDKGNFTLDWEFDLGPFTCQYDTKKQYVIE
jgi:hypothetical protein